MPPTNTAHHAANHNCSCGCIPGEFLRMRYFYGQLLGATDLADEQAYHAGKQRFHNRYLHGWGTICGLAVERAAPPPPDDPPNGTNDPDTTSTVLRVRRGAALDRCGNEIVVPGDYCIDVNAWFRTQQPDLDDILDPPPPPEPDSPTPTESTTGRIVVVIRYQECPSEPTLAPRDPCGCADEGCEYARIRETFRLDLATRAELSDTHDDAPFPWGPRGRALAALADPSGRALREAAAAPCPAPKKGGWLVLAIVPVTFSADRSAIIDVGAPDIGTPLRRVLLSTSALQAAFSAADSNFEIGPRLLTPTLTDDSHIRLPVHLVTPAAGPPATPLEPSTVTTDAVELTRFEGGTGWVDLTVNAITVNTDGDAAELELDDALTANTVIRLTIDQDPAHPWSDAAGRAVSPLFTSRGFTVVETDSGDLALAPLPN